MTGNPLITIIIAIYNGETFLEKCLNSVKRQDYRNIEVLLIDDGSTDGSGRIADKYAAADERFTVIHKENEGVSKTRNCGLDRAKGDYICIVDQDDILAMDYISYHLNLIKRMGANMSLVPQVVMYTEKNSTYSEKKKEDEVELWSGEKAAAQMLYANIEIGPWNKLVSRELIYKNNIRFHQELFGGEGYAFSVECFQHSDKVAVGYKGVYYYRLDNNTSGMSIYRPNIATSSIKAINIMRDELYLDTRTMRRALEYANWNVYYVMLLIMHRSGAEKKNREQYRNFIRECHKYPFSANFGPISLKRKLKGMMCWLSPQIAIGISTRKKTPRKYGRM
ncbi:glycosyltransferase [Kineothrix sp. MSJ-39]|uniref:glycosyltransferase family 2 protein n=1 Tax=Kineothrix sp. MSJ-39 TaxID=2841533 RepID=UPI001C1252CD|nr:glycosyltransferase family 2 protein [Kineothrix sp. MSJ-39]MBU5428784.1 glycosyltransferase [Kineothrix sp. MSJ-39]